MVGSYCWAELAGLNKTERITESQQFHIYANTLYKNAYKTGINAAFLQRHLLKLGQNNELLYEQN